MKVLGMKLLGSKKTNYHLYKTITNIWCGPVHLYRIDRAIT